MRKVALLVVLGMTVACAPQAVSETLRATETVASPTHLAPGRRAADAQFAPCADLTKGASRISYAAPEASACCGDTPACARLLATTVIQRQRADLRT